MSLRSILLLLTVTCAAPALAQPSTLTLEACRTSARAQHPDVMVARSLAAAEGARQAIARAGFLPELTADGSYLATRGSGGSSTGFRGSNQQVPVGTVTSSGRFFGPAEHEIWSASLSLRQTIWDFGRTLNRLQASQAATEQARARQRVVEELVDLAAEATYRAALASGELLAAMDESLRQAQAHLDLARGRGQVGLSAPYDVSRAEVEVANARVRVIQAQNAQRLTRVELGVACGMEALPQDVALAAAPPREIPELPSLDAAMEEALRTMPELREARAAVEVAEQLLDAAWSELYPTVGLTGTAGLRGKEFDDMSPGWTAIVSLSVPLISGGGDLGRIRERRALLAAAEASYTNVRRDLLVEIQAALLSAEEAQARLEAAQAKETAAAEGLRLAEGRFQTGLGSALELADAQSQLASAKAERVQSSLDLSVSAARLERLLGRWSPP